MTLSTQQIEDSILNLERLFSIRTTASPEPINQNTFNRVRATWRQFVILEGEVMIFGDIGEVNVKNLLSGYNIHDDDYRIYSEGFRPVYFCESESYNDRTPVPYYLQESDLPYGFASADGSFQFSSPELANLQTTKEPLNIDDIYVYPGPNAEGITHEMIKEADQKGIPNKYGIYNDGTLYIKGLKRNDIINSLKTGQYSKVTFEYSDGSKQTLPLGDPNSLLLSNVFPFPYDCNTFGIEPTQDSYMPFRQPGWRVPLDNNIEVTGIKRDIIQFPSNQMESFEVNPLPQEPYLGAEGVYPVVVVEFLRDLVVNV